MTARSGHYTSLDLHAWVYKRGLQAEFRGEYAKISLMNRLTPIAKCSPLLSGPLFSLLFSLLCSPLCGAAQAALAGLGEDLPVADPGDAQADAEARCHQGAIAGDGLIHTAANRPATDDSQVHLPHKRGHRLQIIAVRDNFFLETNEITEAGETRRVRGKWKWIAPQTESGANEVGSFAPASIQGLAWQ